jgi:acyl carrier protein
MTDPAAVQARLLEFLGNGMFSPETQITLDTDLIASGFDSLSLVSLLVFIEQTYGLWIPQNEINETNLRNIRTVASLVVRLLNEGQPPS